MTPEQFQVLVDTLRSIASNVNRSNWWEVLLSLTTMAGTIIALYYSYKSMKQVEISQKDEFIPIVLAKNARPGQDNNRFHSTEGPRVELLLENHGKGIAIDVMLRIGDRIVNSGNLVSVPIGQQVKMIVEYTVDPRVQTRGTGIGIPVVIEYRDIYSRHYRTRSQIESQHDGWFDFASSFVWEAIE